MTLIAATKYVFWALNTPKNALFDRKRISGEFRAHGTCLVAANVVSLVNTNIEANVVVSERT